MSDMEEFVVADMHLQVDGKQKVMYALTQIKGVGRRYSNLVCKKADVDLNKRYDNPHSTHRSASTNTRTSPLTSIA